MGSNGDLQAAPPRHRGLYIAGQITEGRCNGHGRARLPFFVDHITQYSVAAGTSQWMEARIIVDAKLPFGWGHLFTIFLACPVKSR